MELFKQAASAFRMADQGIYLLIHPGTLSTRLINIRPIIGKEAGRAFERAASVQRINLKEPDDAANTLMDAFKCYRMSDPPDAARVLKEAINHYETKSNFRRAASLLENLGELCEKELSDSRGAVDAYQRGAKYFRDDLAEA